MNNYIFFWPLVALFFLFFELSSPGLFYFLSFSCGAFIVSLFVAAAPAICAGMFAQAMFFLFASVVAFFVLRKWVNVQTHKGHFHSNVFALQGKKGIVITPAIKQQFGHAHIGGEIWSYKVLHNEDVAAGQQIEVVKVKGAHVIVRPVNLSS